MSSVCSGLFDQCDVKTKKCVTPPHCNTDADCASGYACALGYCSLNCGSPTTGAPSDSFCAQAFKCQADNSCQAIGACTPNGLSSPCNGGQCDATTSRCVAAPACADSSTCGNYACSLGSCQLSCGSTSDCSGAHTCDTASGRCI